MAGKFLYNNRQVLERESWQNNAHSWKKPSFFPEHPVPRGVVGTQSLIGQKNERTNGRTKKSVTIALCLNNFQDQCSFKVPSPAHSPIVTDAVRSPSPAQFLRPRGWRPRQRPTASASSTSPSESVQVLYKSVYCLSRDNCCCDVQTDDVFCRGRFATARQ